MKTNSTRSRAKNFWYCLMMAFFGSVRMRISVCLSSGSSADDHRQAADELGDQAVLEQVFGDDLGHERRPRRAAVLGVVVRR